MTMWLLVAFAFTATVAWIALTPLVIGSGARTIESDSDHQVDDAKERVLRALRDLDLDFKMGKISAEEFEAAKRSLSQEAARYITPQRG